jgi:tRNA A-37 threonylcarbamoyl transferase component Bud32
MQHSPARSSIDVGSVIADTYTIEAVIGRGGMGAVFVASHKRLPGKKVAIKVLHAELSGDEVQARFKREAEIASRLGHPNIVQVHDFNVMPDGTPYLVLEFLHGESLAQRLRNGPMPLEQAMSIVRQVGSALAAAHREGIVHRDLKPQNIFLVPTEVDGRIVDIAKVLDFGISKIRGSQTVKTQDSALLGTPQYMAPEQATGQHALVDERTDLFAFGAIVYEMLTGQPAFTGETIPEVVFKVVYEPAPQLGASAPPMVGSAVARAMAKKPEERFAHVGEFVEAVTGQPLAPGRAGASIPPPDVGFASGSRGAAGSRAPNVSNDAFARTMGSGDHAQAVGGGQSQAPAFDPRAATVDSRSLKLGTDATVSAGPGVAQVPPAPTKKKPVALIVAVLGAAAIAAVAMYFVMRPPADVAQGKTPATDVAVVAMQADASVVAQPAAPVDAAAVVTVNEAPKVVQADTKIEKTPDAKKPDAKKPDDKKPDDKKQADEKKPDEKKTETKTGADTKGGNESGVLGDDDETGDEHAAKKLHDAQQALQASQWDRAEQLANSVITSEDATVRQKSRATLIFGTVQCLGRNDESRARAALRKLAIAPKMRRQLIDVCRRAGYLRTDR